MQNFASKKLVSGKEREMERERERGRADTHTHVTLTHKTDRLANDQKIPSLRDVSSLSLKLLEKKDFMPRCMKKV
jgi:hypothetical protein